MTGILKLKFFKYFEIAKVSYHSHSTYPIETLSIGLLAMFRIWVLIQLYSVAFRVSGSTQISGLDLKQTLWVLALTQSFYISNRIRILMKDMGYEIQSGSVAYSLSKPYSYPLYHLASNFGVIGSNLFFAIAFTSTIVWLTLGPIHFTLYGFLAGLTLLIFGYIINNLIGLVLGLSAFWVEDISAFRWIYDKLMSVLGGVFVPLTIFPDSIRTILQYLPFSQLFYNPAYIIVNYNGALFVKYFLTQMFWLVVFAVIVKVLTSRGSRLLAINGG